MALRIGSLFSISTRLAACALLLAGQAAQASPRAMSGSATDAQPPGAESPALIAKARQELEAALTAPDVLDRYRACLALVNAGGHSCRQTVTPAGGTDDTTPARRLWAAVLTADPRSERGVERVRATALEIPGASLSSVFEVAAEAPPDLALPLLAVALASDRPDVRYLAVVALADREEAAAAEMLRPAAKSQGPGRSVALAALAAAGDRGALAQLRQEMPELAGRELFEAGRALSRLGDPDGASVLRSVLTGPEELLALEAAAALARAGDPEGYRILVREANGDNHWLQLRAAMLMGRLPSARAADLAGLLEHVDPTVRKAAARAILRLSAPAALPSSPTGTRP